MLRAITSATTSFFKPLHNIRAKLFFKPLFIQRAEHMSILARDKDSAKDRESQH